MNKKQIAITLGIMCLILTMSIMIQVRTINNTNKTASQSLTNNDLRDQVLKWKEKYDQEYEELQNANKNLERVRTAASKNTEGSEENEAELLKNNMIIGLTDVEGEGVIVTLKDDTSITSDSLAITDSMSNHLVHDSDLISIVNELKNAGAEAISINDQRVVISTSITCEGNVISVNGAKVGSPFVIKAIGHASYMESALTRPGGPIKNFTGYIGASVKTSDNIQIPKFTGVISTKFIKNAN